MEDSRWPICVTVRPRPAPPGARPAAGRNSARAHRRRPFDVLGDREQRAELVAIAFGSLAEVAVPAPASAHDARCLRSLAEDENRPFRREVLEDLAGGDAPPARSLGDDEQRVRGPLKRERARPLEPADDLDQAGKVVGGQQLELTCGQSAGEHDLEPICQLRRFSPQTPQGVQERDGGAARRLHAAGVHERVPAGVEKRAGLVLCRQPPPGRSRS